MGGGVETTHEHSLLHCLRLYHNGDPRDKTRWFPNRGNAGKNGPPAAQRSQLLRPYLRETGQITSVQGPPDNMTPVGGYLQDRFPLQGTLDLSDATLVRGRAPEPFRREKDPLLTSIGVTFSIASAKFGERKLNLTMVSSFCMTRTSSCRIGAFRNVARKRASKM